MSIDLNVKYSFECTADGISEADIVVWDTLGTNVITATTDTNGKLATQFLMDYNKHDDTINNKNPYKIRVLKYGYEIFQLVKSIKTKSNDTYYLSTNTNISETDEATVNGYTGIDISGTTITLSEDHTLTELYEYLQLHSIKNPELANIEILSTKDGNNFQLIYDLVIDGCVLDGVGKYIDMSDNELTLNNSGSTTVKILDKNGILVSFGITGLVDNTEVRVYKADDMSELSGVEDSGNSFGYNYTWTEDVDVVVIIHHIEYNPIRIETTLTKNDNSIPVTQQKDRWYSNPA